MVPFDNLAPVANWPSFSSTFTNQEKEISNRSTDHAELFDTVRPKGNFKVGGQERLK
jgi:hypothetical protein